MTTTHEIPAPSHLAGPIHYRRAALGYPHITAPDRFSGLYGLGCLHAIDRPVQVHLSILAAEGRLMEYLGDEALTRSLDRATHFFNFRGDAEQQVAGLNAECRQLIDAYCQGFNDTLARRRRPLLLRLLGVPPRPTEPGDSDRHVSAAGLFWPDVAAADGRDGHHRIRRPRSARAPFSIFSWVTRLPGSISKPCKGSSIRPKCPCCACPTSMARMLLLSRPPSRPRAEPC